MANYTSLMRTSYFKVKDLAAFKKEIGEYDLDIEIVQSIHVYPGKIAIMGTDFSSGVLRQEVLDAMDQDEREEYQDELFSMFEIIQNHLADSESVLVNSIGNEKLRYLCGQSTIITRQSILTVDMEQAVRQQALDEGILNTDQLSVMKCIY